MLSVLIPVYNFDVRPLVQDLHQQATELEVPCEILCFDDGSEKTFHEINQELEQLPLVRYRQLRENKGRAGIRNLLAGQARYDYLLFMDGDSKVVRGDYLQAYIDQLPTDAVLCGGRVYQNEPPVAPQLLFHWWYGKNREAIPRRQRAENSHHGFMTNNFLIPKKQFLKLLFDENIRQYGHEDTLFGFQLKQKGIDIVHLDNPLEHIGLEKNAVFLHKSKLAVENLVLLKRKYPELETRLVRSWQWLKKWNLTFPARILLKSLRPFFIKNLKGKRPKLFFFDLLKLSYYLEYEAHYSTRK